VALALERRRIGSARGARFGALTRDAKDGVLNAKEDLLRVVGHQNARRNEHSWISAADGERVDVRVHARGGDKVWRECRHADADEQLGAVLGERKRGGAIEAARVADVATEYSHISGVVVVLQVHRRVVHRGIVAGHPQWVQVGVGVSAQNRRTRDADNKESGVAGHIKRCEEETVETSASGTRVRHKHDVVIGGTEDDVIHKWRASQRE
jgi:hypothetical protein